MTATEADRLTVQDADLDRATRSRAASALQRAAASQEFWITIAVIAICGVVTIISPRFGSAQNFGNIAQNFSFIALITVGMIPVLVCGGIDISVGSILGFSAVAYGMALGSGVRLLPAIGVSLAAGTAIGLVNGALVALLRLPPFIVTLATLAGARSLTLVVSGNQIVYAFGPDEAAVMALGGGGTLGIPNVVWAVLVFALLLSFLLRMTLWGRWVAAIGGNEEAARSVGIPVAWIKVSVYAFSGLMCGTTAVFLVGWLGSVTNALGTGQELQVIAASVIGGASLTGGYGTAYGAVIGSLLVEIIRNALLLAGVNPFWQGLFVCGFILAAVLLERLRHLRRQ